MYPREAEVLFGRVKHFAELLQNGLEYLGDPGHVTTPEQAATIMHNLIHTVRSARFDVDRLSDLTASDTAALRAIYSHATVAIDRVRTCGALGALLDPLADIQDVVAERFPGDVLEA